MNKRKPIEPVSQEARERLRNSDNTWIILGRPPGSNSYQGYVEHSWHMGWDENRVCIFWSGPATSNLGTKHVIDGKYDAERHCADLRLQRPDWEIAVWNWKDENLPVTLDIEGWIDAQAFDPNTLSGVSNKFAARNAKFEMKV